MQKQTIVTSRHAWSSSVASTSQLSSKCYPAPPLLP